MAHESQNTSPVRLAPSSEMWGDDTVRLDGAYHIAASSLQPNESSRGGGYSRLVVATRYGRKLMLKALREDVRGVLHRDLTPANIIRQANQCHSGYSFCLLQESSESNVLNFSKFEFETYTNNFTFLTTMKRILLTAVSLVFAFIGMAQSVTIDIQKRPKPQQELEMVKSTDNDLWKHEHGISSDTIYTHSKLPRQFVADGHALINCVHTAYADHRPLVLSPDMLWLVIAQGFAVHVNNNAEKLRPKLVKFDGKKELIVIVEPGLLYNKDGKAWEPYFEDFADQMAKFTGQGLIDLMTCDFSTSTPASVAASQVKLPVVCLQHYLYT